MSKLLSAGFERMKNDKVFRFGIILMTVLGAVLAQNQYSHKLEYGSMVNVTLDEVFFNYIVIIGVLCAVFCSLFIGTEYSDGTIRNKLIVGHTRWAIYLSNLIVSIISAFLMCIVFIVSVCVVGIPLIGFLEMPLTEFLPILFGSVVVVVAFCAICTMMSMLISSKSLVAVISITGFFLLLFVSTYIEISLEEPEYTEGYYISDDGVSISTNEKGMEEMQFPNPNYLSGTKRAVYEFLNDFLPTGQAMQYGSLTAVHLWQMPLYSMIITIVTTVIGAVAFRRKNIK